VTTFLTRIAATDAGRPPRSPGRPASGWAFTGLAVTSFGDPLALAALAVLLAVFRRVVLMAAAAVMMAATAAGLLLSAGIGLFGFQESLAVPYAGSSLVAEFASAAVLAAASAIVLAARPGSRAARR